MLGKFFQTLVFQQLFVVSSSQVQSFSLKMTLRIWHWFTCSLFDCDKFTTVCLLLKHFWMVTRKLADMSTAFRSRLTHINIKFQLCFWLPDQWTCTLSPALVYNNYWEKYLGRLHFWLCSAVTLSVALSVCHFLTFFAVNLFLRDDELSDSD